MSIYISYILLTCLYLAIVVFAPSLALAQVTGLQVNRTGQICLQCGTYDLTLILVLSNIDQPSHSGHLSFDMSANIMRAIWPMHWFFCGV